MSVSKPVQYPAASGPYKVFIKGISTWNGHNTARLHISMGNPKQDGVKLFALAEWSAARFDKVIFIVSDTLQRHNLALRHGISLEDAHKLALMQGHEWMTRNKAALNMPRSIVTLWDDWLSHPDYTATRQELNSLYHQSSDLKEAVAAKAFQFCKCHDAAAMAVSTEFLLEEVAAIGIMLRETPAADFYAGTWLEDIYSAVARFPASDLMRGFQQVHFTEVDFVKNKAAGRFLQTREISDETGRAIFAGA